MLARQPKSVADAIALYRRSEMGKALAAIPSDVAIVCDMSGSMREKVDRLTLRDARRRVDFLREALAEVVAMVPAAKLIGFNYTAREVATPDDLGEPVGSTHVEAGLELAKLNRARHVVLISDGEPTDERASLATAATMRGVVIDCVYVGPETNTIAVDFMRRLAAANGGQFTVRKLGRVGQPTLGDTIKKFLLPG